MSIVRHQPRAVLLDTCFLMFMDFGPAPEPAVIDLISGAGRLDGVFVSPVSAWEIGLLSRRRGGPTFHPDPKIWFATILAAPTIRLAPFTADIAIDSSMLPPPIHKDPADRLLIATARFLGVPIVTRDRLILDYADAGHLDAIVC